MNRKEVVQKLIEPAGIEIGGKNPWDIEVYNENFYSRVLSGGTLGLGESYMEGWWDAKKLDEFFFKVISADLKKRMRFSWPMARIYLKSRIFNIQTRVGSRKVAKEHYDLDNQLYEAFLDPYNQYTCGYFKNTSDLNKAQENKLDLICKKLQLKENDRVLDIGCGWGGFAKWAAEHYGCYVTGISISDQQISYAKNFTKGLTVEIFKKDYRDIDGKFDKILICGMLEHVGYKNYKTILRKVHSVLSDDGIFLLHTIGRLAPTTIVEPWIEKYIFPNSMAPASSQILKASENLFVMEDWHNFGQYYDPTLMAWWKNFEASWPKFEKKYDKKFYRMFKYYFLSCAGAFRARNLQLWQMVFSKKGIFGGYQSVR